MAIEDVFTTLKLNQAKMSSWNPFRNYERSTEPGYWKTFQDEEFQKITSMSTDQLFDYIRHLVFSSIEWMAVYHMMVLAYNGQDVAAEYKNTMLSILMKLKGRLGEELQIFDDIQNVREVMTGEISLPDHTALFCVHKHMVRMSKMVNVSMIRRYLSGLSKLISKLESGFEENRNRYLNEILPRRQREEEMERAEARRKRKRRAPERLNITSTKSKSYL